MSLGEPLEAGACLLPCPLAHLPLGLQGMTKLFLKNVSKALRNACSRSEQCWGLVWSSADKKDPPGGHTIATGLSQGRPTGPAPGHLGEASAVSQLRACKAPPLPPEEAPSSPCRAPKTRTFPRFKGKEVSFKLENLVGVRCLGAVARLAEPAGVHERCLGMGGEEQACPRRFRGPLEAPK